MELLKRPKYSFEIRIISDKDFNKIIKSNHYDYQLGRLICVKNSQIIYIKQDSRSALALDALLRDLKSICVKYNIPELVIIKNKKCAHLINEMLKGTHNIKNASIKISIIKDVENISDLDTRQIILNDFHMLPTGGHAGINRMYNNIKKYYFWTGLRQDVEKFVKNCNDCQRYKHSKPNIEPMSITTTASCAFQKVFLDIVGPIETDANNKRYILTLQCELSKFVEGYPLENKEATTVAKAFVENFILRYGVPEEIVTDQGTEFLNSTLIETCKLLEIKQLKSTAYHHETLGSLENSHKGLGAYLRIQIAKHQDTWSFWIPYWCFAYNNTVHTETKYTPHELVFGKPVRLPSNIPNNIDPLYNFENYPLELKYRLQQACNDAYNNLMDSKIKRKERYDVKSRSVSYNVGDKVLLRNNSGNKTEPLYKGPYVVVEERPPNIILSIDNKIVECHKSRIKLYFEEK